MHRTIEITVPTSYSDELIRELEQVINLSVVRGASIKPEGEVLTVHVLNNVADEVLRHADEAPKRGQVSVTTAELPSIIDPEHERKVANDVDEALEPRKDGRMDAQLRVHSRNERKETCA